MSEASAPEFDDGEIFQGIAGCLVGLAVGDALGTAVEFQSPGAFEELTDMIGGGAFDLNPGQWTDDTSMALCLAESLIECGGYNPFDQAERYWTWYDKGHFGSTGICFDIGGTTVHALTQFNRRGRLSGNPYLGGTSERSAGNGSLMRLAAVPLVFYRHPQAAIDVSGDSSRVTHNVRPAIDACRYFAGLLVGCLRGEKDKEKLLSPYYSPFPDDPDYWQREENQLVSEISEIAGGSFARKEPPQIVGAGYVVKTLEAVLWAFRKTDNFKDGCLLIANLGHDADTTAAIYGQLAGAFYGLDAIPKTWRDKITFGSLIELMAGELVSLSKIIQVPRLNVEGKPPTSNRDDLAPTTEAYKEAMRGLQHLEKEMSEIIRKVNKHGRGYQTIEEFDEHVKKMFDSYEAVMEGPRDENLVKSFEEMVKVQRRTVEHVTKYRH
ncbi:ADP-ribosylarginine hydrolase Tri1-like [Oscarella lobularis]|uniref:ADP-ribosylarginine hydrolase Tri1-like n=1 Tax=Oscarella lobularis TaxID=121494 RepID=UPI003313A6DE